MTAALPPGVDLGIVYCQHTRRNAFYSHGDRCQAFKKLKTDIRSAALRAFTKLGDYVIDPQIIVPFSSVSLKEPASGIGQRVGDPMRHLWLPNRKSSGSGSLRLPPL